MPIKSYKIKGTLTFGATPLDVSCQVTSCVVTPTENVTTDDAVHVLCGEVLPSSDTVDYSYTLDVTVLQDLSTGGLIDYSWENAGQDVDFDFVPDDSLTTDPTITGTVRVIPLIIGGEVPGRPTSDFSWVCTSTPTFTPGT